MSTVYTVGEFFVERLHEADIQRSDTRRVVARLLMAGEGYWKQHHTLSQVLKLLEEGMMQFWTFKVQGRGEEPFLGGMTQVHEYGLGRIVQLVWIGGHRFGNAIECLSAVESWARDVGCMGVEVMGRDVWVRLLAPQGYVKSQVVLYKPLGDEHGGL